MKRSHAGSDPAHTIDPEQGKAAHAAAIAPRSARARHATRRFVIWSATLLVGVIGSAVTGAGLANAVTPGVEIANVGSHKCVTALGGPDFQVVQEPCSSGFGQHWTFKGDANMPNAIRQVYNEDTGWCLQITSFQNAGRVGQGFCGSGDPGIFWSITNLSVPFPQRRSIYKSYTTNFCLDLENGLLDNGLPLQVWQCNSNTNNQKWDVGDPPETSYPVTNKIQGLAGKCMDVNQASSANGTQVQLYHCNGTNAQVWTMPGDGTVRALGKCLDVQGGSTAAGTRVQLWDCNGSGAQQWFHSLAYEFVNPQSNRCLDVIGANSSDFTPLQIWNCNQMDNQRWSMPFV
jgi:hypothetical protein